MSIRKFVDDIIKAPHSQSATRRVEEHPGTPDDQRNDDTKPPTEPLAIGPLRNDQPIESIEDDLLNRERLVEGLALQIEATTTEETMVIALNAPWGTGKSSFIHLLSDRLKTGPCEPAETSSSELGEASQPKPIIVDFNPWMYGNVQVLIQNFFSDLGRAIGEEKTTSTLAAKLLNYGILVAQVCPSFPAGLAAIAATAARDLLPSDGDVSATGTGTDGSRAEGVDRRESVINAKKGEIDRLLGKIGTRVIVFVDDIDRLEADTTELLFRMLRLCGNLKNVTYVLAFDSDAVERHLNPHDPASGRRYLEKITQVSYNIPRPSRSALRIILQEELDDVVDVIATDSERRRRPNARRYERMLEHGMARHFGTIRGVKRYVNALRLSLRPVKDYVDLVDFFVIELVRVVYPDIYLWLSNNRYRLLRDNRNGASNSHSGSVIAMMEESGMSADVTKSLVVMLSDVFPALRDGTRAGDSSRAARLRWTRERRACCRKAIDSYFLFTIPDETLSEREQATVDEELREAVRHEGDEKIVMVLKKWARSSARKGSTKGLLDSLAEVVDRMGIGEDKEGGAPAVGRIGKAICTMDAEDALRVRDRDNDGRLLGDIIDKCITHQQGGRQIGFLKDLIGCDNVFTVTKVFRHLSVTGKLGKHSGVEPEVERELGQLLGERILSRSSDSEFWRGYRWYSLLRVDWAEDREDGSSNVMGVETAKVISAGVKDAIGRRIRNTGDLLEFCETWLDLARYRKETMDDDGALGDIRAWLPAGIFDKLVELREGGEDDGERARGFLEAVERIESGDPIE